MMGGFSNLPLSQQSGITPRSKTLEKIRHNCNKNELALQVKKYKQWFKTRALKYAHGHYYNTAAEVKSNSIIDDMFSRLDADGGGSLDCGEITTLFKENGIHMSQE